MSRAPSVPDLIIAATAELAGLTVLHRSRAAAGQQSQSPQRHSIHLQHRPAQTNVAGVRVPGRSLVVVSPYLVHRHPDFWPGPAGFDPRRFLPGGHGDPVTRHRYAFIPFSGGRRACVGASFAELETVIALAALARRFRLDLTACGIPAPLAQVTLRPGRHLPMRLRHRR